MIDSVLKGTGNSRFLKSAVPAGTSWADALAMLQAGTFPIDFNGINTEGFQQVGTPLNKANLLKDATAAQIGLPPSTTPDGMFRALGNTGELHVWRKTVTTAQEIPAKYELGELQTGSFQFVGSDFVTWEYGTPIVGDDGTVSLTSPGSSNVNYSSNLNDLRGKYCKPNQASGVFLANQVIFIPSDAVFTQSGSAKYISKYQPVIGTPKVPAGTTTTYPVSTNPNAYQEGSDAKEAGYTLGEVVTGSFQMAKGYPSNAVVYETANSVNVGADGAIILNSPATASFNSDGFPSAASFLGKFIRFSYRGASGSTTPPATTPPFNTTPSEVVYIPTNATITHTNGIHAVDRYQPVTGYAAIPAGTTIEYLGKLGDKARVQVVSYVGTGTYGSGNQNMLQLPFEPKYVIVQCLGDYGLAFFAQGCTRTLSLATSSGTKAITCSWPDAKTLKWYGTNDSYRQLNASGVTYVAIAIG